MTIERRPCRGLVHTLITDKPCPAPARDESDYCRNHGRRGEVTVTGQMSVEIEVEHAMTQGQHIAGVIRTILDRLDLTPEQQAKSRQVVIDVLRETA